MSRIRVACIPLLALLLAFLAASPAWAQTLPCELIQVVEGGSAPALGHGGEAIAFLSRDDLTGDNAAGSLEVFVWHRSAGFLQVVPGPIAFKPVSDTHPGDPPRPDADASRLVYSGVADPLGGNADGDLEVFFWDSAAGLSQLTDTTLVATGPAISPAGTRVAFRSTDDLVGENPGMDEQLFVWDEGSGLRQITHSEWSHYGSPAISGDGSTVAFAASNQSLWSAGRTSHVVLWDEASGLRVLTAAIGGDSRVPFVNGDGTAVAFSSTANVGGTNPDGGFEALLWREAEGIRPLTSGPGPTFAGGIDDAGRRVVFQSTSGGERQVLLWDLFAGVVAVTSAPGGTSVNPSLSGDGLRVAFVSDADLVGEDPDRSGAIYLATCPQQLVADVPAATPFGSALLALWLAALGAGLLAWRRG